MPADDSRGPLPTAQTGQVLPSAVVADDGGGTHLAGVPEQRCGTGTRNHDHGKGAAVDQSPRQPAQYIHGSIGQVRGDDTIAVLDRRLLEVADRAAGKNDHLIVLKLPPEFRLPVRLAFINDNDPGNVRRSGSSHGPILDPRARADNGLLRTRTAALAG